MVATTQASRGFVLPPHAPQWPDELQLLLGPDADGLLAAVVGVADGTLRNWRPRQVAYSPSSTVVQYSASVAWPDGFRTGETLVAATGDRIPSGAAVVEADDVRVGVWRWPHDPALPGLAAAVDPARMSRLLADLGLGSGPVRLQARAYRPGRRAVIEATGRLGRLFLKVVRPHKIEALHHKHRMLADHLPVPSSLGWSSDGVLAMPALPGRTMREALRRGRAGLPDPAAIDALLDRFPETLVEPRPPAIAGDHLARVEHYAAVVAAASPHERGRLDDLISAIADAPAGEHPLVPVHGDFYESQLLVDNGRVVGVLDVDTAGAGHRIDDIANLIAHLSILGLISDRPGLVKRYGALVMAHADGRHDPTELRLRVAAAVIALATGPFRVVEPGWGRNTTRRLDLAEEWINSSHTTARSI